MEYEIKHLIEAKEITPDGVAAAAGALAAKYRYIKAPENPLASFWFFFDKIYEDIDTVKEAEAIERERVKRRETGSRLWESMNKGVLDQLPWYAFNRLKLGYCAFGILQKPLEELTDTELRCVPGIGAVTLANIRSVIPYKDNKEDKL